VRPGERPAPPETLSGASASPPGRTLALALHKAGPAGLPKRPPGAMQGRQAVRSPHPADRLDVRDQEIRDFLNQQVANSTFINSWCRKETVATGIAQKNQAVYQLRQNLVFFRNESPQPRNRPDAA
jgi:hypothetical protein